MFPQIQNSCKVITESFWITTLSVMPKYMHIKTFFIIIHPIVGGQILLYSTDMIPQLLMNKLSRTTPTTWQMNTLCQCSKNVTDCRLDVLGHVYPGQTLQVELCLPCSSKEATLHVETHNRLLPSSACKIVHQNQLINFLTSYSSILNFTIVSNATEIICELFLTVSPYLYQIYEVFYVKLRPCPIGFVLLNGICDCDPVLFNNKFLHIKECEINHITIKRPPNSWIAPTISGNSTYSVCSNCPMDYCLPLSSDLNLQNPDLQCQFNRTGVLCSQCQHSLSMVFWIITLYTLY